MRPCANSRTTLASRTRSEQQRRDIIEFVVGNVIFAVVHEVGHMLVSELALPVLGHEEDAADAFAIVTGLKLGNAFSDRVLSESARGWFLSEASRQEGEDNDCLL